MNDLVAAFTCGWIASVFFHTLATAVLLWRWNRFDVRAESLRSPDEMASGLASKTVSQYDPPGPDED